MPTINSKFDKVFNAFVLAGMFLAILFTTVSGFIEADSGRASLLIAAFGSLMGILCVLCSANGKIFTFLFGVFDVSIYAGICFFNWKNGGAGLGNALINGLYFLPMQFYGFFQWKKRGADSEHGLKARRFTPKQYAMFSMIFLAGTIVAYFILAAFDKDVSAGFLKVAVLMDAISMVCNFIGQFLLSSAYMEQWIFWIIVNVSSTVMWVISFKEMGDTYSAIYAFKYFFYLLNSINGLRIWIGLSKGTESLDN